MFDTKEIWQTLYFVTIHVGRYFNDYEKNHVEQIDEKYKPISSVGRAEGLEGVNLILFTAYTYTRFRDGCPGYWAEWATRFRRGGEWFSSDGAGRELLKVMSLEPIIEAYDDYERIRIPETPL